MVTPEHAQAIYFAGQQAVVTHLCGLHEQVVALQQKVKEQEKTIAQLSKNSSNSSKRPSSDDITKPKNNKKAAGRSKKKKKIGGQPGHPKHTRPTYPPEAVDEVHEYESASCPHCGGLDILFIEDQPPRVMQQLEVKEIVVVREEHRAYAYWCEACQQIHWAEFPSQLLNEGLFKARLTALVAYMKNVCHTSFSTIRKFIRDVLGEKVSRGYLAKIIQKVSQSLQRPYEELLERIPLEATLNVDETGHKNNGDRFWTWVFKAELYVLFRIDKSRSSKVLIEVIGKEFEGTLGCDYFSAYRKYMKDFHVAIQFCIAHLIRDIKFLITLPDEPTRAFGEKLLQAVKALFKTIHRHEQMSQGDFQTALAKAKTHILDIAINKAPSQLDENGKEQHTEAQNMANRFRKHGKAYFQFITTPGIDPTNNVAEQAIRFIVIDRHVTQGTRSLKGQRASERLWTVIGTCALQGRSAFAFILQAVQAFFQDKPPPSLLPAPP